MSIKRADEKLPRRLDRTVLYESDWVSLYGDRGVTPNGHLIERYHFLDLGLGSVAAIVENDAGHVLMERVARYPTQTVTWELPAGGIEVGESALEAAEREVMEETGYGTLEPRHVYTYHPINGISNLNIVVVHCRVGSRTGAIDENEIQDIRWFSPDELQAAIRAQ